MDQMHDINALFLVSTHMLIIELLGKVQILSKKAQNYRLLSWN